MIVVPRFVVHAAACAVFVLRLLAQDPALLEREAKLTVHAVEGLHSVADAMQGLKQHLRALELRREIWLEYDENDQKAREKTGFVKVGNLWRKDDTRLLLDKNLKPDARAMRKVEQQLTTLTKELLDEHRALAQAWAAANDTARAQHHWQRVLRFHPGDTEASSARALDDFEGFRGDAKALHMLRRARAIRGAADWLNGHTFEVAAITGRHHPLLEAAGITHQGARSDNFEVWGSLPPADLQGLAQDCERALLLSRALFGTAGGQVMQPARVRNLLFVDDKGYAAVLDKCSSQFTPDRLAFLKKDVDLSFVEHDGHSLRLYRTVHGMLAWRDQAVRGVVQDAVGVFTDGIWEGLGHAACGILFGRTLTFMLEQQTQRTVATWTPKVLAPDLTVWMQIAEESAWAKSDTRTSELVLLSGARFTSEQRVKAWAICHYLLHVQPDLICELDRCQSDQIHTPPDVEAEFLRRTKLSLPTIDTEWRDFWARGSDLRKAMAADGIPNDKAPDREARLRAKSLVDAIDNERAAAGIGPAGFYFAAGAEVAAAQQFDVELAKAEALQKKKPKEQIPLPELPAVVGRTLWRSTAKDAAAAVAEWLLQPAKRDVLLHPGRDLFAANVGASSWLLDVALPAQPSRSGPPLCWPHARQKVPGSVRVVELGPRAAAALQAAGKQPQDEVGTAVTLHFVRAMPANQLSRVQCRLYQGSLAVDGVLVVYAGAADEPDTADGVVAFVPLSPLASGADIEVRWQLPPGFLAKDETFEPVSFTVR